MSACFKKDGAKALAAAKSQAAKAGIGDRAFITYLASVNFQLGTRWHKVFRTAWQLILDGKYTKAADSLSKTNWNKQTPKRVKAFQKALLKLPDKQIPPVDQVLGHSKSEHSNHA